MCAGGTIAFEMALQLRVIGQEVGFVALLDASDARARTRPFLKTRRRLSGLLGSRKAGQAAGDRDGANGTGRQRHLGPENRRSDRIKGKVAKVLGKVRNLVAYERGELSSRRTVEAKVRVIRDSADRGGQAPKDFEGPSVRSVYGVAERAYSPRGKLDARVILVRAGLDGVDHPGDEPHLGIYRDPYFGWGASGRRRDRRGSRSSDVPGGHGGMAPGSRTSAGDRRADRRGDRGGRLAGKARP